MELKEFIKEVLADITDAVSESQQELKNGSVIIPSNVDYIKGETIKTGNNRFARIEKIDFEISVAVEDVKGKKGVISVMPTIFGLKGDYGNEQSSVNTSIIKFSIPIVYPYNFQ